MVSSLWWLFLDLQFITWSYLFIRLLFAPFLQIVWIRRRKFVFFINGWLRNEKRHKLNSCFISTNREIWQQRERARTRENLFSNKCYTLLWMISYFFLAATTTKIIPFHFVFCFGGLCFFPFVTFCHKFTHTHAQFQRNCVEYWHPHTTKYIISPLYTLVIYFSYSISLLLVIALLLE